MDVKSLGFRTDLLLRRLAGADVVDRGDYLVVRSPANPAFWWGNFLLFGSPAPAGQAAGWLAAFVAEFPDAAHRAIGVDGTDGGYGDEAEAAALGLDVEVNTVLTARSLTDPAQREPAQREPAQREPAQREPVHRTTQAAPRVVYRALASDEDWAQGNALTFDCDERSGDPVHRRFLADRQHEVRELCRAGHGAWFGAFVDGRMRSGCGVFADGTGLARYQNVETHPGYRRRGLASNVVYAAGRHALGELRATTLVIVADPNDVAIGIYRSLGFADSERQVQLQRERPAAS